MATYRWDDLEHFLALWRTGSLSGAAQQLGVNPSTVSRRLAALEEALDVQLFERSPEGVLATVHAERLLVYAEAVEQAHQAFDLAVSGLERDPVGSVRITGPPGLIDCFIAPAVGVLRARWPGIRVELDASVGYADLSRGEADIAIRGLRPTRGDLVARKLGPYGSAVIGAARVFEGAAPTGSLADLPWLQWGEALAHIPDARWIAEHVPDEQIVLRTNSFAAQLEAARSGVGVMLAAVPFAELEGVVAVPLTGAAAEAVHGREAQFAYLVGHQALRRVPRVAVVWDFLVAHMQDVGAEVMA